MPTLRSILLIDDSPGECELFRLAIGKTGHDVDFYVEQGAEAALHFLNGRFHEWSFRGSSPSIRESGLNWSPTARIEGAHSDRAASASKGDRSGRPPGPPSLILLDWHLRDQHGGEFLKRLRADARFAAIPVVVFTTSDHLSDIADAYAHGANGYVVKPGMFDDLVHCVGDICRYWLDRNRTPSLVETRC